MRKLQGNGWSVMTIDLERPRVNNADFKSATVMSLRIRNRSTVLKQVILSQETTRARLVKECNLSAASVTNLVNDLIAEGLVVEVRSIASQGGRPIAVIAPRADGAYVIGADVGERGVAVELFDLKLNLIDREFSGGRVEESPELISSDLNSALVALRERNPQAWGRLL
jgi:hypothetical protein